MGCNVYVLFNPIKELQQAWSNILLAWVQDERTHSSLTVIIKMLEVLTHVTKSQALRNLVSLITHVHARAGRADVRTLCHAQPPAHLNGQSMSSKRTKDTSGTCICYLGAAESMALALNQCTNTSNDTCKI